MITLSEDDKLIRVANWEDILGRPRYTENLDPKQHQLQSILGRYIFKDPVRCGLSDCHTLHQKGYLVLTKDNRETNIGKDCGRRYFGVDFETLSRQFEQDFAAAENRERLWGFRFQVEEVEAKIDNLREPPAGADWLYRHVHALKMLNSGCPEKVVRTVAGMVKAQIGVISRPREATDDEVRMYEAMEGRRLQRPHFIDEMVGELEGVEALFPANDLRQILVIELGEKIKEFRAIDIDALTHRELRTWSRWVDSVEPSLERAKDAIGEARVLLAPANLLQLDKVLNSKESAQFRMWVKTNIADVLR